MQIGGVADDEAEDFVDDSSGLMMELGDDAFGGQSDIPAVGTPPPPPPLDLASSAPAELRALRAPLLLDVTPLSLGVETVDGYCEHIIRRNSAIPAGQTKMFTTARDRQEAVIVRICQGEDRKIAGNQLLGEVILEGLRPAARGKVQIAVRFMIDADGTLQVRAQDVGTGQQQQIAIEELTKRHEAKLG